MEDIKDLQIPYHEFFFRNEAGKHFMSQLAKVIVDNHEHAEKNPELARDYVQRAKGAREVLQHIEVVSAGVKEVKK